MADLKADVALLRNLHLSTLSSTCKILSAFIIASKSATKSVYTIEPHLLQCLTIEVRSLNGHHSTERHAGIITFGGPAETKQNGAAHVEPRHSQLQPKGRSSNFSCSRQKGHLKFSQSGSRGPVTGPKCPTT